MTAGAKPCFKCGEVRPLSDFYRHPQMGDGHLNKCKPCTRKDARDHRNDNLEACREYDRQRANLPHRKELRQRIASDYTENHPDRRKAHSDVANALRDGRLSKEPCAFCGASGRVEAHHHDYAKPLDVTWLCTPCHRRFHALERMATYRGEEAA